MYNKEFLRVEVSFLEVTRLNAVFYMFQAYYYFVLQLKFFSHKNIILLPLLLYIVSVK